MGKFAKGLLLLLLLVVFVSIVFGGGIVFAVRGMAFTGRVGFTVVVCSLCVSWSDLVVGSARGG